MEDEPTDVAVRRAGVDDAAAVAVLLHDFNTEFETPTPTVAEFTGRFERLLARDDVLVLLADGAAGALGFAFLTLRPTPYWDGPLAQLEELYVRPGKRDRGIGSLLLTSAIDALPVGTHELHIGVDEPDTGARRFYERHGFTNHDPESGAAMLLYLREL